MNEELLSQCQFVGSIDTGVVQISQLALVVLGLKPAAELNLYFRNMLPADAEERLVKAGLKYKLREPGRRPNTIAEYAISKDENLVERLLNASTARDFGTLFGYPDTAIQAFENGSVYEGPLPPDIKISVFKFRFSQAHHEQEFETIRKWDQALLRYAPELFRKWHQIHVYG